MSVPLAVSAISGEALKEEGITQPRDLANVVTGLQFQNTGPTSVFAIRGVTLNDFGDSNESPVAFYRDDVYIAALAGTQTQMFDINHVEILRGPQGTLFGRNATGGLVHTVSNQPTDYFAADASIQYGSYNQVVLNGAAGGPINDKIRIRSSFTYNRDDGWQLNRYTDTRLGSANDWAVRQLADIDLTDKLMLSLNVHGGVNDDISPGYGFRGTVNPVTGAACTDSQIVSNQCTSYLGFRDPNPSPTHTYSDVAAPPLRIKTFGADATFKYNGDNLTITSITAYERTQKFYEEDSDANPESELTSQYNADRKEITQEIRASGEIDALKWVGGLYFFNERIGDGLFTVPDLIPLYGTYGFQNQFQVSTQSGAAFSQVDYDILPDVTLTGGIRYSVETKHLNITDSVTAPTYVENDGTTVRMPTWKVGANWRFADGWLSYAAVSTGFKSPAFNTSGVTAGGSTASQPERNTNYELGVKGTTDSRRIQVTSAFFYTSYREFQLVDSDPSDRIPVVRLINIPKADIYGFEEEAAAKPLDGLTLNLNATWTHTKVTAPGIFLGGIGLDGLRLTNTPQVTLKGSAQYDWDIETVGTITPRLDFSYRTSSLPTLSCAIGDACRIQAYWLANAGIAWKPPSGDYLFEAFVENMFDKTYETYSFVTADVNAIQWGKPRMWGIRASAHW